MDILQFNYVLDILSFSLCVLLIKDPCCWVSASGHCLQRGGVRYFGLPTLSGLANSRLFQAQMQLTQPQPTEIYYNKLTRALLEQGSLNSIINSSKVQTTAADVEPQSPLHRATGTTTGNLMSFLVPASSTAFGSILDQVF